MHINISPSAPINAKYLVQQANGVLTDEQELAALATGLVKNTTGTGVQSIGAQGTDYYAPGGTDVAIADGGTGQSTAQLGINALTNVAAATNEHVLTKDTASGNAIFKVAGSGSSPPFADTQTIVMGSADNTKLLRLEVDGFTTGVTRVLTPPNADILLAGQNFANSFSAAQTFTTFTTSGDIGIRSALDSRYGIFLDDTQTLSGTLRSGQRISIFHAMVSGNSRSWGLSIAQTTANVGDAEDIYGIRADVSVGNTGATSLAVGVGNTVSMTGAGAISAFYGGLYTAKVNGGLAGSITTFVCSEAQLEIGAGATTTITNAYIMRGSNFISGGTISNLYGLFLPSITQGSTNYAIYTNTGLVRFGDRAEIEQPSTTAAVPTLKLTQLDLSEELVEFSGTVATGNPIEAVGAKTLTTTHFIRVSVNGSFVYIPVGTIA